MCVCNILYVFCSSGHNYNILRHSKAARQWHHLHLHSFFSWLRSAFVLITALSLGFNKVYDNREQDEGHEILKQWQRQREKASTLHFFSCVYCSLVREGKQHLMCCSEKQSQPGLKQRLKTFKFYPPIRALIVFMHALVYALMQIISVYMNIGIAGFVLHRTIVNFYEHTAMMAWHTCARQH